MSDSTQRLPHEPVPGFTGPFPESFTTGYNQGFADGDQNGYAKGFSRGFEAGRIDARRQIREALGLLEGGDDQ